MSLVLPFEIITLIIDIVGENEDTDLLKELALVSHSFLKICSRHLFATVELHDADPILHVASPKRDSSNYLKVDQKLSSTSANSSIKRKINIGIRLQIYTARMIYSHLSFQVSSDRFLVLTTSKSTLLALTGMNLTLS